MTGGADARYARGVDATPCPDLSLDLIRARHPAPVPDDEAAQPMAPEETIRAAFEALLATLDPARDLWVFGYGSLMWRPEMDFAERRTAHLDGWHRRFCLWQWRYRGSRAQPGMMLAIEPGGTCTGAAFRLAAPGLAERLRPTWWREMRGMAYTPRFVTCTTDEGPVAALTFTANPAAPRYAGHLDEATLARNIARACGASGPSAEYLYETWRHCREAGIADPMLDRLQALVAAELLRAGDQP